MGRIGALREASGFCITNPGPAGWIRARTRIRAPQDRSGPRRTYRGQGPRNGSGPCNTNQGPAGQIRTPNVESRPAGRIMARGTDQDPAGRIRAPQNVPGPLKTNQGLAGRIRAPCDEPGLSRTKRGPPHRIYFFKVNVLPQKIVGKSEEFFTPRGPKPSSPRVLLGCLRVKY